MASANESVWGEFVGPFRRRFAKTQAGKVELPAWYCPPRPAPKGWLSLAVEQAKRYGVRAFVVGTSQVPVIVE